MKQAYGVDRLTDRCFAIVERATGQTVAYGSHGMPTRAACGRMNKGETFDGWTPSFMLREGPMEVLMCGKLVKRAA